MRRLVTLIISCFILITVNAQVDSSSYVLGNILYEQGNYSEAIKVYQNIIDDKGYSAELNYNLGNCFYKTGDIGNCILNYERALQLDPGNDDIQYNLDLANLRIRDKLSPVEEVILAIWWRNIINLFTTQTWAIIAVLFAWIAFIGFFFYRFNKHINIQKTGFYLFAGFFILFVFSLVIAFSSHTWHQHHQYAIVMEPSSILKSEPNESSTNLTLIHEGLKIQVMDVQDNWTEIKMADGNVGWLLTSTIEKI